MTMHTKESIASLLAKSDKAVYRGLVVLYQRQTADEKSSENTKHQNGVGFNATDAKFGTSLAKQVLTWQEATQKKYPNPLSKGQIDAARRMIRKYAGQLANVANELISAEYVAVPDMAASFD
jgi:hypothetical protein